MNAQKEVELAISNLFGCNVYTEECYKSALKAYESMESDGHSGLSWSLTSNILIRMLKDLPLTPITEDDEFVSMSLDEDIEQCVRYSSLFREKQSDGSYKYSDNNRYTTSDKFSSNLGCDILDALFPITLPYFPPVRKCHIELENFDTDGKAGCFNTMAIYSVTNTEGDKVEVNRYWKETGSKWEEIDHPEFLLRKQQYLLAIQEKK